MLIWISILLFISMVCLSMCPRRNECFTEYTEYNYDPSKRNNYPLSVDKADFDVPYDKSTCTEGTFQATGTVCETVESEDISSDDPYITKCTTTKKRLGDTGIYCVEPPAQYDITTCSFDNFTCGIAGAVPASSSDIAME